MEPTAPAESTAPAPATPPVPATLPDPRPPAMRLSTTGTLTHGLPVSEVLRASTLAGAELLAGASGLDRVVQRLNVMEVPDILPWVKPHELLLTTGYPLRNAPEALAELVEALDARGLSALAIKVGRYLDALPLEMLAAADRLGFPIILLPNDVGFDDILNQVLTDILNRQAGLLARSEEVHRALVQIVLAGGGLRELASEVAAQLCAAVYIFDAAGRVVAEAGPAGRARPPEAVDGTDPRWVQVPVVAAGVHHGRIVAHVVDRDPDPSDVSVLERSATVAALVVTRQLAVTAVDNKYRADFLRDVLDGRAGDRDRVVAHAATLGWDLDRPVVVAVAELDPDAGGDDERLAHDRLVAAWARTVRSRDHAAAVAGFSHQVVVVLGAGADCPDPVRTLREAHAVVGSAHGGPRRDFSTGLSRVVTSPEELPAAYAQATKALAVGRQIHGPAGVTHFDDLGVFRLLSLVPDGAELRSFLTEVLGPLADVDDPDASDLRRTLEALLETNLNVAETARRLHFHYNTLRYRIGKLERILGPFTSDSTLRLNVVLALHALRMRGL